MHLLSSLKSNFMYSDKSRANTDASWEVITLKCAFTFASLRTYKVSLVKQRVTTDLEWDWNSRWLHQTWRKKGKIISTRLWILTYLKVSYSRHFLHWYRYEISFVLLKCILYCLPLKSYLNHWKVSTVCSKSLFFYFSKIKY